jgi:glycosyltransferase involved in cell wall biosynthesis
MFHSIIIPHRNRFNRLAVCVDSLERSAKHFGATSWEIVIVDNSRTALPDSTRGGHVRVVHDHQCGRLYNKSIALNLGISNSTGDVLTFLDIDAIVGNCFLESAELLLDPDYDRVCYRVRTIDEFAKELSDIDTLLAGNCDSLPIAFEAYGRWDHSTKNPTVGLQPWGNSQFSIRRNALGDLRYDAAYQGHGYEDLDMNMRLWAKFGDNYRGHIFTDINHSMLHVESEQTDPTWNDAEAKEQSMIHYRNKRADILAHIAQPLATA